MFSLLISDEPQVYIVNDICTNFLEIEKFAPMATNKTEATKTKRIYAIWGKWGFEGGLL